MESWTPSYPTIEVNISDATDGVSPHVTFAMSSQVSSASTIMALTPAVKSDATVLAVTLSMLLLCLALSLLLAVLYAHGIFGQHRNTWDLRHANETQVLQNTQQLKVCIPESAFSFANMNCESSH